MAKKNRECLTCGEKYSYCSRCNKKDPAWKSEFHSENCKNIFQICVQFNAGSMTKEAAKEALEACDLSNKENFKPCIQRDFANIFAVDEDQSKKRERKSNMTLIDKMLNKEPHEVVTENE